MKPMMKNLSVYALAASMALSACSVVAERPEGVGRGRDNDRQERRDDDRRGDRREDRRDDRRDDRHDRREDRRDDYRGGANVQVQIGGYFGERQRASVYEYYGQPVRAHCPPGLAKKGNGCQPPGQAKQWRMGQPLPRDVSYRPVEAEVRVRLGTPPAGHEFVRVAGDILLIAVGTSMVIDAIEDLQR
jgi:Ni/Co efflux regulator RcnB